ncbi:hypothetical protein [Halanaerobium praevalens]|uniref:Apea-like HEPN domain-containing protein n=1 Tax=Halanaerobium praevalens (strain ATCC 33744 / DSM 2228 / GSL) TaxID=572479 RepID=E3DLM7_HALPG|nr:hypothetical protein [Halanaerobium praevalens]ADO77224.1 hypothetical protein Hprae_1072 [Halanaerobium praevalens DSM 2228]
MDIWSDLIDNFNKKYYGLDLINPQLIIDEINFNELKNKNNNDYFYDQLKVMTSQDPILKSNFKSEFSLLKKEFKNNSNDFLRILCYEILEFFTKGKYFKKTFSMLKNILLNSNNEESSYNKIRTLSQTLIVELLLKGYNLETIKKLPENIFDKYNNHGEVISTNFPHNESWEDYKNNGEFDQAAFNEKIKTIIDNLSIEDRLNKFYEYWSGKKEYYFIFEIIGLRGEVNFNIGKVNFYNPKIKKYIKNKKQKRNSEFFNNENDDKLFLNAAVKIETIDIKEGENKALELIERALDLLRSYKSPKKVNYKVNKACIVVDKNGRLIRDNVSVAITKYHKWHDSPDLKQNKIEPELNQLFESVSDFLYKPINNLNEIEKKIIYSLHWLRKGEETFKEEDELLNYWVVIESLLNFSSRVFSNNEKVIDLSLKLLIPIEINNFIYNMGWELYWYIWHLLNSSQGASERRYNLKLSEELLEKSNLDPPPNSKINLSKFIDSLSLIENEVERKIVKDKVQYAKQFYSDNNFLKKEIDNQISQIENDILMIYRYRNEIVHNAHYENTIIPFYAKKANEYSGNLLRKIIKEYSDKNISIKEILTKSYVNLQNFLQKLEQKEDIDLLNIRL